MASSDDNALVKTANSIRQTTSELSTELTRQSIASPDTLEQGSESGLWTMHDPRINRLREKVLGLTQHLTTLLQGPHEYLHEYVSVNWEHGALYVLLEFNVLEKLPLSGTSIPVRELASQTALPADKLLRICRLVATSGVIQEPTKESFSHTSISERLVKDKAYKSFIRFQLFETRVASAHLADSLRTPDSFWAGSSAFEHAWGMPMHEWHRKHPEKGNRFIEAMKSVSESLDPGKDMMFNWMENSEYMRQGPSPYFVEVEGKAGTVSFWMAAVFPNVQFEVENSAPAIHQQDSETRKPDCSEHIRFVQRNPFDARGEVTGEKLVQPMVFVLYGVLRKFEDYQVIKLLQTFVPAMLGPSKPRLVVCDLVSPEWGTFEPHVERAFRRRDVTLMTMHNVKQRTSAEWRMLITQSDPRFRVTYTERHSTHSCRGLWEIHLGDS